MVDSHDVIVPAIGDRLLDALGPGLAQQAGPLLVPLAQALVTALRSVDEAVTEGVLRTTGDLTGQRSGGIYDLFNLDRSPSPGWLGQWAGVPWVRQMSRAQQIAAVRTRGLTPGTIDAIEAAVRGAVDNLDARVDLLERTTSAYRFTVRTYERENTRQLAVEAAVLAAKPVGLLVSFEVLPGQTWGHLAERPMTFGELGQYTNEQIRTAVPGRPIA